MIPIVVAMLRFVGVEDLWNSTLGTSLVLAVAWGSSLGGFLTPLGGAPNLLAMKFVQDMVTHHEFLFTTWVTRLTPLTIGVVLASAVYIAGVFKSDMAESDRPRAYYLDELRGLGPMTGAERVSLLLFVSATVLAFMRGTYSQLLPALTPAYAFLALGLVALAVRTHDEPLLTWEFAQNKMMWGSSACSPAATRWAPCSIRLALPSSSPARSCLTRHVGRWWLPSCLPASPWSSRRS